MSIDGHTVQNSRSPEVWRRISESDRAMAALAGRGEELLEQLRALLFLPASSPATPAADKVESAAAGPGGGAAAAPSLCGRRRRRQGQEGGKRDRDDDGVRDGEHATADDGARPQHPPPPRCCKRRCVYCGPWLQLHLHLHATLTMPSSRRAAPQTISVHVHGW